MSLVKSWPLVSTYVDVKVNKSRKHAVTHVTHLHQGSGWRRMLQFLGQKKERPIYENNVLCLTTTRTKNSERFTEFNSN